MSSKTKNKVFIAILAALVAAVGIFIFSSGSSSTREEKDNLSKEYKALLKAGERATQAFAYSESGIVSYSSNLEDAFEISTKGYFHVPTSGALGSMQFETTGKAEGGSKPTLASELTPDGTVRISSFGAPEEVTAALKSAGRNVDWVSGSARSIESKWPATWSYVSPANARQAASASVSPSALLLNFGGVPIVKNTVEKINSDGSREYTVTVSVSGRKATGVFKVDAEGFLKEGRTESFGAISEIQTASWNWGAKLTHPAYLSFKGSGSSFDSLTPPKLTLSPTPTPTTTPSLKK